MASPLFLDRAPPLRSPGRGYAIISVMKVSELGEFGLIELLAGIASRQRDGRLIIGIGDDAAAWRGDGAVQLATIDSLIEKVHFSLKTTTWEELGWKALAVNLSDIAAMGGAPGYALVSLALPPDTDVDNVTAMYRGMMALAEPSGVAVVGGDTCAAPLVSVTVALFGSAADGLLTRSGARPGDQVAVTGYLGSSAAGLEMLTRQLRFDPATGDYLRRAHLRPVPRVAEGQALSARGVRAGIDISDGLLADLGHVAASSGLGARVTAEQVPVHPAVREAFGEQALEMALGGGEDYELLFTAPAGIMDGTRAALACPVTVIGEMVAGKAGEVCLLEKGRPRAAGRRGWEHFRTQA